MKKLKKREEDMKKKPTHYIECRHCMGKKCKDYIVECVLLKRTKSGKAKILLFGERYWKQYSNKRSIRYVEYYRLKEI